MVVYGENALWVSGEFFFYVIPWDTTGQNWKQGWMANAVTRSKQEIKVS